MKMRILFVTNVYQRGGGTEKHLEELIIRLDFSRVEPVIVCFGPDVYSDRFQRRYGLKIKTESRSKTESGFAYWRTFVKSRPHVIIFINGSLGLFSWRAYLAARCATGGKIYSVEHSIGEPVPETKRKGLLGAVYRVAGWRARLLWRYRMEAIVCRRIICVSDAVRRRLVQDYNFPESRTLVVQNGIDLNHYRFCKKTTRAADGTQAPSSEVVNNVLCVANLTPPKRIDTLLEAMRIVLERHPNCTCTIVGEGEMRAELTLKAQKLGIGHSVQFVGYASDVRPYYEMADIFALSSQREGLPLVLLEAMAYELPCVATNVGGNAEVIIHGETGFIVEPENPEQLAQAIIRLCENPDLITAMGIRGRQRVTQHFNIEDTAQKLKAVFLD